MKAQWQPNVIFTKCPKLSDTANLYKQLTKEIRKLLAPNMGQLCLAKPHLRPKHAFSWKPLACAEIYCTLTPFRKMNAPIHAAGCHIIYEKSGSPTLFQGSRVWVLIEPEMDCAQACSAVLHPVFLQFGNLWKCIFTVVTFNLVVAGIIVHTGQWAVWEPVAGSGTAAPLGTQPPALPCTALPCSSALWCVRALLPLQYPY